MEIEFSPRDYKAEEKAYSLNRLRADDHPLSSPSSLHDEVNVVEQGKNDFSDPLRELDAKTIAYVEDLQEEKSGSTAGLFSDAAVQFPGKEWTSFKKILMQRFPVSKMISISSMSSFIVKSSKGREQSLSSVHLEELDNPQKFAEEGVKLISQREYVSRLNELKDEIASAWHTGDRVTSLKLSIKVAMLLMDTSLAQFYPTLFLLATDVLDMLGDMVWERIRQKAELSEDGTVICSLPDNFKETDVSCDAKETCFNWFCKIGSIYELLPRIYLELAILPCWRFLTEHPVDYLNRLVMMTRGIADPLAAAYCHLYMVHCARKLPKSDIGYLITCVNDFKVLLMRIVSVEETTLGYFSGNRRLLIRLMDPAIEFIMTRLFEDAYQVTDILLGLRLGKNETELFGKIPCISIILHHILKELPIEIISSYSVEILNLIESSNDCSIDQCLNYRSLAVRLCERILLVEVPNRVIDKVIKVVSQVKSLDEFAKITDAYMDILLHNQMEGYLNVVLDGIFMRACNEGITEDALSSLQSIFVKLLSHFSGLDDIYELNHFIDILDMMRGSSRSTVNRHILNMARRSNCIRDPRTIQFLFDVSQALHDDMEFSNMRKDDKLHPEYLISRFVNMVDYGPELERHLTFLIQSRGTFSCMNELKETLVYSSNQLANRAMRDGKCHAGFLKSCLAFSEVTIPSIPCYIRQLNLYLLTAEVALLGGLVSHADGLVDSALICLQLVDSTDGLLMPNDLEHILSLIQKLCSLLVVVPGRANGITAIHRSILSVVDSKSWVTPRMKIRVLCAIISSSAALSQNELPYHASHEEVIGNDRLFFGDPIYCQELLSLSSVILQNMVNFILEQPSKAVRGNLALEACNCIVSSFRMNHDIAAICSKLVGTAKSCLSANDKYLQSTLRFVDKHSPPSLNLGS